MDAYSRLPLERALAVDSGYLPALYDYALTKPTHELKMQALNTLARMDPDNAAPYYIMAVQEFRRLTQDRPMVKESEKMAQKLSAEEWASVLYLIRKGNERPRFAVVTSSPPSIRDLKVCTRGREWPAEAVKNGLVQNAAAAAYAAGDSPGGFTFSIMTRAMARQGSWEALKASRAGKPQEASDTLPAIKRLGEMVATAEPRRLTMAMSGLATRHVAEYYELVIARGRDSDAVKNSQRDWMRTVDQFRALLDRSTRKVVGLYVARNESLLYHDYAAEETAVTAMLRKFNLAK